MKEISRNELKRKLDRGEDIKLVFALGEWQYQAMHIPGSLHLQIPEQALDVLSQDDEVVVYCSTRICRASIFLFYFLLDRGFKNVRRFTGGLEDWASAGYPLEGEMAAAAQFAV